VWIWQVWVDRWNSVGSVYLWLDGFCVGGIVTRLIGPVQLEPLPLSDIISLRRHKLHTDIDHEVSAGRTNTLIVLFK
jgi:hypothetical protein